MGNKNFVCTQCGASRRTNDQEVCHNCGRSADWTLDKNYKKHQRRRSTTGGHRFSTNIVSSSSSSADSRRGTLDLPPPPPPSSSSNGKRRSIEDKESRRRPSLREVAARRRSSGARSGTTSGSPKRRPLYGRGLASGNSSTGSMWNMIVPQSFGNSRVFLDRVNTPKNQAVRTSLRPTQLHRNSREIPNALSSADAERRGSSSSRRRGSLDLLNEGGGGGTSCDSLPTLDTPPPSHATPSPPPLPARSGSTTSSVTSEIRRFSSNVNDGDDDDDGKGHEFEAFFMTGKYRDSVSRRYRDSVAVDSERRRRRRRSRRRSSDGNHRRRPLSTGSLQGSASSANEVEKIVTPPGLGRPRSLPISSSSKRRSSGRGRRRSSVAATARRASKRLSLSIPSKRRRSSIATSSNATMRRSSLSKYANDANEQMKPPSWFITKQAARRSSQTRRLRQAALGVNNVMKLWMHKDKAVARAWHTWVSKYYEWKDREIRVQKARAHLLPPPPCVVRLVEGTCDYHDNSLMKRLIAEASEWCIEALACAHLSKDIKHAERELLGIERFTTNLDWAGVWDTFREKLKNKMTDLGAELNVVYEQYNLQGALGTLSPRIRRHEGEEDDGDDADASSSSSSLSSSSSGSPTSSKVAIPLPPVLPPISPPPVSPVEPANASSSPGRTSIDLEESERSLHIDSPPANSKLNLPPGIPLVVSPVKRAERKMNQVEKVLSSDSSHMSIPPPPPDSPKSTVKKTSVTVVPSSSTRFVARQDVSGMGVPLPPCTTFHTTFDECCYIHYLRLVAIALNADFQRVVNECLAPRDDDDKDLLVDGKTFHKGIKGFERMLTKMLSARDHRNLRRPRPAQNIDVVRCLAVSEDAERLKTVIRRLETRFGGFVKFKNGMQLSKHEAAKVFHLRLIMVSVVHTDTRFRNFREMCENPQVKELWRKYARSEPPINLSHGTWKRQITRALKWIHDPALARRKVRMICEVQCMLRNYRDVRFRMHEIYKAQRAVDQSSLFHDFLGYSMHARRKVEYRHDGRTLCRMAARDGDMHKLKRALLRGSSVLSTTEIVKALNVACKYARVDAVKRIVGSGRISREMLQGDVGVGAFIATVVDPFRVQQTTRDSRKGCIEIASYLLRCGRKVSLKPGVAKADSLRFTESGNILAKRKQQDTKSDISSTTSIPDNTEISPAFLSKLESAGALHIAVQNGQIEIVEILVRLGLDANCVWTDKGTPLLCAAIVGNNSIAKILLKSGADPNLGSRPKPSSIEKSAGTTPLIIASQNGHVDVVELLLACGADPHLADVARTNPLYIAVVKGHLEIVKLLVRAGARVKADAGTGASDKTRLLLFSAAQNGFRDIVKFLIDNGANVHQRCGKQGATPLSIATSRGFTKSVRLLLAAGARVDEDSEDGGTALHIAADVGGDCEKTEENQSSTALIDVLLASPGARERVNQVKSRGASALYVACQKGHVEIARRLLECGADKNLCRDDQCSPLYIAAKNGHAEVIRLLLRANARIDMSSDKTNPMYVAAQNGHAEALRLLLLHEQLSKAPSLMDDLRVNFEEGNGISGLRRRQTARRRGGRFDGRKMSETATSKLPPHLARKLTAADRRSRRRSVVAVATVTGNADIVKMLIDMEKQEKHRHHHHGHHHHHRRHHRHHHHHRDPDHHPSHHRHHHHHHPPHHHYQHHPRHTRPPSSLEDGTLRKDSDDVSSSPPHSPPPGIPATLSGVDPSAEFMSHPPPGVRVRTDKRLSSRVLYDTAASSALSQVSVDTHGDEEEYDVALPLFIASKKGNSEIVSTLLRGGSCPINAKRTKDGATPLHLAVQRRHFSVVRTLLKNGADPNMRTNDGLTPLCVASLNGDDQIISELIDGGARVEDSNALEHASNRGHTAVVRRLLQEDSMNDRECLGQAHESAVREGHTSTASIIRNFIHTMMDDNEAK